ncbi:hypothetical protein ABZT07_20720 [Streptomyces sp. NPDC005317]|uniref:hypothetical protein n=1 Tax=Streptomyces sp. NPDC005317 TaxID=3156876 RepID=UPI0033B0B612
MVHSISPQPPNDTSAPAPMLHAGPKACGTCRSLARDGKPIEHEQCAAHAVLLLPPDQPAYEDLVDLTDEQRKALPARFHTPVFDGLGQPNAWLCQVCWGDGWVAQWPCGPAQQKGALVFESEVTGEDTAAELIRLRARVAELEAQAEQSRTESIADVGDWLEEVGEKGAAYLVRTCDIPAARDMRVVSVEATPAPRDLRPGAEAARRMIRDRQTADSTPLARRLRRISPMEELARDLESVIAPLKGDARRGAELALTVIRTRAAAATIPTTEDAS